MKSLVAVTIGVWGLVFAWAASAQTAGLPGTVQPGQIQQQFREEPKMRAGQPEGIAIPEAGQAVPANAQDIRFQLTRLIVEGATVYSAGDLQSDFKDRLNTTVSLSDIYQIASVLTAKYRNDGYILSRVVVPAQSVEAGEVRLKAIEGYVVDVTLEGVDGGRRNLAQRYAEKIRQDRPLTNKVLERYLLLMNDLPGAFASAVIKPSKSEPGAAEMTVRFTQQKVQGGLSLDNRGGKSLGPLRLSADVGLNNVLGLQESTQLRVVDSLSDELSFVSFSHDEHIGSEGGKVSLSLSAVESRPEEMAFIPLNLETSSRAAALTYSHPLIRSRPQNLFLRTAFTVHDGETQIFGIDDTRDRIRAFRIGATYDLADAWRGINLLDIEFSQGIDGLGASDNHDLMLSRPDGRVDFTKAAIYLARLQSLAPQWSVLAAASGQYAFTDLLSSELYSFGGAQFGRGYDPSELVGDHGAALKLELRYAGMLPAGSGFTYTVYGFYDVGIVYQRSSGGLDDSESGASAGLGLKTDMGRNVSFFIELAKPLTRDVSAEGDRDLRGYAGAAVRF